jgi:undecaprenyl-diphosphatase
MIPEYIIQFDTKLFLFFNDFLSNRIIGYFFISITNAPFWIIPGIVAMYLFYKKENKKALIAFGLILLTVAIADPVSSQILKPFFERHRPCHPDFLVQGGHFLQGLKASDSFPSSHSMNMFALATLLSLLYPLRWYYFIAFASLIGFSRIYVGVHFPIDIFAGAIFGSLCGLLVFYTYTFIRNCFKSSLPDKHAS